MPESFTFCGTTAASFPETRDAHAVIIGFVNPGDEREFTAAWDAVAPEKAQEWFPAPTADWFPSGGPLPKRLPDPEPDPEGEGEEALEGAPKPPAVPPPTPRAALKPAATTPPPKGSGKDDD
jgi:hypothetical protein